MKGVDSMYQLFVWYKDRFTGEVESKTYSAPSLNDAFSAFGIYANHPECFKCEIYTLDYTPVLRYTKPE